VSILDIGEVQFDVLERPGFDYSLTADVQYPESSDVGIIEGGVCKVKNPRT
jgi:coenzyme F420-reducing hydrogenase gamma subunit